VDTDESIETSIADNLLYKDEVYMIIGAAMEVHTQLGCGFLEAVYQEALELEFREREIPFEAQKCLSLQYKGLELKKGYVVDMVAYGKIIIELKALERLTPIDEAQIINYLKATGFKLGLLINFGSSKLEWKRRILTLDYVKPSQPKPDVYKI